MLNKPLIGLLLGSLLLAGVAKAVPVSSPVNINFNPSLADSVAMQQRDPRFHQLRQLANAQAAKRANQTQSSYVTQAPDSENPTYWKHKDVGLAAPSQAVKSVTPLASEQQVQRQKTALQKMLTRLKALGVSTTASNVVTFSRASTHQSVTHANHSAASHTALALPGSLWYATMASGADSYIPGPVMAIIQEGPFAGGKALGKFALAPDGEHLILTFNQLTFAGRSRAISAVAMDPQTRISGVTGDIDHHFLTRFILPGAASFLEKVTQALLVQSQSIVSNPSGIVVTGPTLSNTQLALMGAGGAASSFASATRPTGVLRLPEVTIKAGQGIGFLILKPIV